MAEKAISVKNYEVKFLSKLLYDMLLIRRFEEKSQQMYGLKKIGGFCHLYIGQEATAVGSIATLDLKKDYVLTAYRDHGHALACGMDPNPCMAEMFGKITGCARGKGGSMHMFDVENHMYGGNGIVGAQAPIATGVALKIKYRKEDGVVLCYFGDGAVHQGVLYESMNLAKVWSLPIVFICENNIYGMGTHFHRVSSVQDLTKRALAHDMPGEQVPGMNVLEVYEGVKKAVERARKGTPSFLEIRTYRYRGHSMSDPAKYRTKEELQEYRDKDSIVMLKQDMIEAGILSEDEFKKMDEECKKRSADSVEFAENSEEPPLESMYEDILA